MVGDIIQIIRNKKINHIFNDIKNMDFKEERNITINIKYGTDEQIAKSLLNLITDNNWFEIYNKVKALNVDLNLLVEKSLYSYNHNFIVQCLEIPNFYHTLISFVELDYYTTNNINNVINLYNSNLLSYIILNNIILYTNIDNLTKIVKNIKLNQEQKKLILLYKPNNYKEELKFENIKDMLDKL